MEPPTPQCVGREFVHQYYTQLNQDPLNLHRLELNPPTPQCAGREFVHQYYTQLNQDPLNLHRLELNRWWSSGGGADH